METKEILQYRRPKDSWICPCCETENDMASGVCMLCGARRAAAAPIARAWSPEMERRAAISSRPGSSPSRYSSPGDRYRGSEPDYGKSSSGWSTVAILAVIIFAICIIVYVSNNY